MGSVTTREQRGQLLWGVRADQIATHAGRTLAFAGQANAVGCEKKLSRLGPLVVYWRRHGGRRVIHEVNPLAVALGLDIRVAAFDDHRSVRHGHGIAKQP